MPINNDLFVKDPQAKLDYAVNWTRWLDDGDEVTASSWAILPNIGLVLISSSFTPKIATIVLASGTVGQTYSVTNHITTLNALEDDKTFSIVIQEK